MKAINKQIEMIAEFKRNGEAKPIRFRVENDNSELHVYSIKQIMSKSKEKFEGKVFWKFNVLIENNQVQQLCEIRYYLAEMHWILYKI